MSPEPAPPHPRRRDGFLYQEVRDGGVLFDPAGEKVYVLNPSAAFIWNSLDGRRSSDDIARELREALGTATPDPDTILGDVQRSLGDFARQGLLEPS